MLIVIKKGVQQKDAFTLYFCHLFAASGYFLVQTQTTMSYISWNFVKKKCLLKQKGAKVVVTKWIKTIEIVYSRK